MRSKKYIYIIVSFMLLLCSCKDKKQHLDYNFIFHEDVDTEHYKIPLDVGNFTGLCKYNGITSNSIYRYLPIGELLDTVNAAAEDYSEMIIDPDDVVIIDTVEEVPEADKPVKVMDYEEESDVSVQEADLKSENEDQPVVFEFDTCRNLLAISVVDLDICVETNTVFSNVLSRRVSKGFNTVLASEGFVFNGNSLYMRGQKFDKSSFIEEAKQDVYKTKSLKVDGNEYQVYSQFCGMFFDETSIERIQSLLEPLGGNPRYVSSCCDVEGNKIDCVFKFDNGATITFISAPYLFTNACLLSGKGINSEVSMRLLMHGFGVSSLSDIRAFTLFLRSIGYSYGNYYNSDIDPSKKKYREIRERVERDEKSDPIDDLIRLFKSFWQYLLLMLPFILKRKHRAIPVMDFYKNKTKDYVKRVGVLYFKEGDWLLILRKKITCFTFDMAERFGIDISSENPVDVEANASVLARSTHLEEEKMKRLIVTLNKYRYGSKPDGFNESVFNSVCDDMNEVQLRLLNIKGKNIKN